TTDLTKEIMSFITGADTHSRSSLFRRPNFVVDKGLLTPEEECSRTVNAHKNEERESCRRKGEGNG
ncbi:2534_t:CDS:1, partial [Funneliformis geosporum]